MTVKQGQERLRQELRKFMQSLEADENREQMICRAFFTGASSALDIAGDIIKSTQERDLDGIKKSFWTSDIN